MSGARGLPARASAVNLVPILRSPTDQSRWAAIGRLIRERRSNLRVDPDRPVPRDLVEQLLELACWAPNHQHTQPWRFCVVTGAGREQLGAAVADALRRQGIMDAARLDNARRKYLRAPVVLVVGSAAHEDPVLDRENRDAVAAGIQNLLLGATAIGLASFWASPPAPDDAHLKQVVGLGRGDQFVAVIYLGWPTAECPPGQRNAPAVTTLDGWDRTHHEHGARTLR